MSEKLKILVVDDNKEFCQNLTDILELKDYAVENAYDGFQGLERVKQVSFDFVIMDIRMPEMNGLKAFRKIKAVAPTTKVIMVTAYAVEDQLREALREGAFGALKKPLDFDKLFGLIESATRNGAPILVVDDDENFCDNLRDTLSDKGYRVSVAYDGNSHPIELVTAQMSAALSEILGSILDGAFIFEEAKPPVLQKITYFRGVDSEGPRLVRVSQS